MSSVDRIFLTVISAAPVGLYSTDFAFNIAALIAAGELTSRLGASPRRPNATGTRAISNLPGAILPAAWISSSTSGGRIATSKSWPLSISSFRLPLAEPYCRLLEHGVERVPDRGGHDHPHIAGLGGGHFGGRGL